MNAPIVWADRAVSSGNRLSHWKAVMAGRANTVLINTIYKNYKDKPKNKSVGNFTFQY